MILLLTGLVLFFAAHSVSIVSEPWRNRMVERMGEIPWKIAFAVISVLGVVLMAKGYGDARLDPVWIYTTPTWFRHLAMLLLLPVFPLFLASMLPGRIKSAAKHPQLVSIKLWAFAHLLVNGTLADILLFGSFLAWAVADRISMKGRTQRATPTAPPSKMNDVIAVAAGLGIYLLFVFWLHGSLIGIPLIPR